LPAIALLNMPFARLATPSLALAQLRTRLQQEFGDRITTNILFLNHDLASFTGYRAYRAVTESYKIGGLGEWFFRAEAFPHEPDNLHEYCRDFLSQLELGTELSQHLLARRQTVGAYLDKIIDFYGLDHYQVVGCTSTFQQNTASIALLRKLKLRNSRIVTLLGGANCETPMGQVITRNVPWIDFVFSGPALKTFPKLIGHLLDGDVESCHKIRGVFSRTKLEREGTGCRSEIGDELSIDTMVIPDYSDYLADITNRDPNGIVETALLFETSRGCWWGERSHCTFCGLNGASMNYRAMEPKKALELFEDLFAYAPRVTRFEGVDNIMPRSYIHEVLPHLRTPPKGQIFYEVKADLQPEDLEIMARAGVTEIQPGVESLATSTLKLMKKGTTSFQNVSLLKNCRRFRIRPYWNLLVGFPGEEEDSYRFYDSVMPLLYHLEPPMGVYPVRFDRFSPYFSKAKEYGLVLKPFEFYGVVYPFPEEELADLAYHFFDHAESQPYAEKMQRWRSRLSRQAERWKTRWHRKDGLLPPNLVRQMRNGQVVLYDSRYGHVVYHELDPLTDRMLDLLETAMTLARLCQNLKDTPAEDIALRIDALVQRGLLFEENGRYLSLVLGPPQDPGPAREALAHASVSEPAENEAISQ